MTTAATMLGQMPVAKLTLNELSRRVGLAKSNVLRYFESREAVLLELLDQEFADWCQDVREKLQVDATLSAHERANKVARQLAASLAERPTLCDLISAQASVLEHNVSVDVVRQHKQNIAVAVDVIGAAIADALPELTRESIYEVVVITILSSAAAWPSARVPEAVQAVYDSDPSIAATHIEYADYLSRTVGLVIVGLLARP